MPIRVIIAALLAGLLTCLHLPPAVAAEAEPALGGIFYVPSAYILSGYSYRKFGDRESIKYVRVVQNGLMQMSFNKDMSGNTPSSEPDTGMKFKIMGSSPFTPNLAVGSSNFTRGEEYKNYYAVLSMYLSGTGTLMHLGVEQYNTGLELQETKEFMGGIEQQIMPYMFLLLERHRKKTHGGIRLRPLPGIQADVLWEDLDNRDNYRDVGFSLSFISYY